MADDAAALAGDRDAALPPGPNETLLRMAGARNYNEWLLRRARPFLGQRVLDVGAGIGTFTALLAAEGKSVVAAEPDPAFVPLLRSRFADRDNVAVIEHGALALSAESFEPVDSVVCFNVLEHIPDDAAALRALRAHLVPGGHLLLLVPAHPVLFGSIDRTVGHERRYVKRGLARRLGEAGLRVRTLAHVNPVGALGWLFAARVARSQDVPTRSLAVYDRVVPVLRLLDRMPLPFGLSLWAVAQRA